MGHNWGISVLERSMVGRFQEINNNNKGTEIQLLGACPNPSPLACLKQEARIIAGICEACVRPSGWISLQ